MTLDEYLKSNSISVSEFASLIGVKSRATVYRYIGGRIPDSAMMQRIYNVTGGMVTANDFYGLKTLTHVPLSKLKRASVNGESTNA